MLVLGLQAGDHTAQRTEATTLFGPLCGCCIGRKSDLREIPALVAAVAPKGDAVSRQSR